jgi:hypothetical protein
VGAAVLLLPPGLDDLIFAPKVTKFCADGRGGMLVHAKIKQKVYLIKYCVLFFTGACLKIK